MIHTVQCAGCSVLPAKDEDLALRFFVCCLSAYKFVKSRNMDISDKISYWHFKRGIKWKMIVLGNPCINPYPEKCIHRQIPITCSEMCSEPLECFPVREDIQT